MSNFVSQYNYHKCTLMATQHHVCPSNIMLIPKWIFLVRLEYGLEGSRKLFNHIQMIKEAPQKFGKNNHNRKQAYTMKIAEAHIRLFLNQTIYTSTYTPLPYELVPAQPHICMLNWTFCLVSTPTKLCSCPHFAEFVLFWLFYTPTLKAQKLFACHTQTLRNAKKKVLLVRVTSYFPRHEHVKSSFP